MRPHTQLVNIDASWEKGHNWVIFSPERDSIVENVGQSDGWMDGNAVKTTFPKTDLETKKW